MSDSVVLLSHPTALASKRFSLGLDGKVKKDSYGDGKYFRGETVPLRDLADLKDLLELLAPENRTFMVRGEVIPGTDLGRMRRTKKTKDSEAATLREIPRRWLMIDVDGMDASLVVDWSTPAGCDAAASLLRSRLPVELQRAGHVWQASSSAGQSPGLRFHFFFWLDRPFGETELERWGEACNDAVGVKMFDLAVFRTAQPLYVADPIFENVIDPVAKRRGYVPGPEASLPKLATRHDAWRRKLEPLYYESNDKIHDHIRDACASYFCSHGPEADETELRKAIDTAVEKGLSLQERPASDYPPETIDTEIASGREFARGRVQAGENLLIDHQGVPKGNVANMLAVMRSDPDWVGMLSWNTRAGNIQIVRPTPWGSPRGEWRDGVDSVHAAGWFASQRRMGVDDGVLLRAAIAAARETEVDPVVEWLDDLVWDGVKRLDEWLIGWCGAKDCEYTRRVSRMWMIGCAARAYQPGCKNDTVLVMQGATAIGKSRLFKVLGGSWYAALTDEKDMLQKIHGPWIIELPELGPFRFMNYNKIKSFTSTEEDRFRAPYMRLPENRPRSCSLAVTLNPEGFGWQEDATSARRFWPVDVTRVDLASVAAAREQLFAEAVVAFKAGEPWWVEDANDADFIDPQASVYAGDEWEIVIQRKLAEGAVGFGPGGTQVTIKAMEPCHIVDLLQVCFNDTRADKRSQQRAAKALTRIGWTRRGYTWYPPGAAAADAPAAAPAAAVLTPAAETDMNAA